MDPPPIDAFKVDGRFAVEACGRADYARDAVDVFARMDHGGIHTWKGTLWQRHDDGVWWNWRRAMGRKEGDSGGRGPGPAAELLFLCVQELLST